MANHGVVTFGSSLESAYMKMETVEHFAKIALVTHLLGNEQPLGEKEVEKLHEVRHRYNGGGTPTRAAPSGCGRRSSIRTCKRILQSDDGAERDGRQPPVDLLPSNTKPESRAKVCRQRRISHHFVVMIVERISQIRVRRDSRIDRIPPAQIDARVAGRMVDECYRDTESRSPGAGPRSFLPDLHPSAFPGS